MTVSIISTGGTIAMELGADGRRVPSLEAERLVSNREMAPEVRVVDLYRMSSHNARGGDLLRLSAAVRSCAEQSDTAIVTHGTDSMEEAAFFVAETTGNAPVVFVGAMIPPGAPGFDGEKNVEDAIVAASNLRPHGTLVCSAGELFPAWTARKTETSLVAGFGARHSGRVARIHNATTMLEAGPLRANWLNELPTTVELDQVALVDLGVDPSPRQVEAVLSDADGCVVQALGAGSVPDRIEPVMTAAAKHMPVVLTTRPFSGPVRGERLYPHTWDALLAAGAVIEDVLDTYKARIRVALSIALGRRYEPFALSYV